MIADTVKRYHELESKLNRAYRSIKDMDIEEISDALDARPIVKLASEIVVTAKMIDDLVDNDPELRSLAVAGLI